MAATVAGRVAFGLGVTPKVCPKCTGAVEGFWRLSCAGMAAAASADLGCGDRITAGLASLMTGIASLASTWIVFRSGLGSGLGILIFGASNFTSKSFGGSFIGGGGGIFAFGGGGGGLVGKINSVSSCLC